MAFGAVRGLDRVPSRLRRRSFQRMEADYGLTSVQAGEVEAVHKRTLESVHRQQLVEVSGQSDVLVLGLPFVGPYNVNSVMNPILAMCLGLGYFFNMYRGMPLVRRGGALIIHHPVPYEFSQLHHPSYVDFFEEVLVESTDPATIEAKFEKAYATDPWYIHLYRTSHAYHGVHPFYMWYWGAHALDHLGDSRNVVWVGCRPKSRGTYGISGGDARWLTRWRWCTAPSVRARRSATCTPRRTRSRTCADGAAVRRGCATSRAGGAGARVRSSPSRREAHRPPPEPPKEWATAWARTPLAVGVRAGGTGRGPEAACLVGGFAAGSRARQPRRPRQARSSSPPTTARTWTRR